MSQYYRSGKQSHGKRPKSGGPNRDPKGGHDPSAYRGILREMKRGDGGKPIGVLLREARKLNDPYYTALALVSLSTDPRLPLDKAVTTAELGIQYANKEARGWRIAELSGEIAKLLSNWRVDTREEVKQVTGYLYSEQIKIVKNMGSGAGRTDTIKGIAAKIPWYHAMSIMTPALHSGDKALEDGRTVIRGWARNLRNDPAVLDVKSKAITEMTRMIMGQQELICRSKLLGYLHLQLKKEKIVDSQGGTLFIAMEAADGIRNQENRMTVLRYLTTIVSTEEELTELKSRASEFSDPLLGMRLLTSLVGSADKMGSRDLAGAWLREAVDMLPQISDLRERLSIQLNIVSGFSRAGYETEAKELLSLLESACETLPEGEGKTGLLSRVEQTKRRISPGSVGSKHSEKSDGKNDNKSDVVDERKSRGEGNGDDAKEPRSQTPDEKAPVKTDQDIENLKKKVRHALALYDAYEGGIKITHHRAIARAAPLCIAFDIDLVLLNFPSSSVEKIIEETMRETNIGKGGEFLERLAREGRVTLVPLDDTGISINLRGLGIPIATTSHPDPKKTTDLKGLVLSKRKSGQSKGKLSSDNNICLIMGLGRKGLPQGILNEAEYHLELTGKNVPLETCTVMGIIAERLSRLTM